MIAALINLSAFVLAIKWGAISSKEHEEAVTLEAAYFGDISGRTSYPSMYAPHPRTDPDKTADPNSRHVANPPSPSLAAQWLLQEQQVWTPASNYSCFFLFLFLFCFVLFFMEVNTGVDMVFFVT